MQVPHIVVTALPNLQLDSKRPRCHMAVGVRHGASPKPLLELALLPASPLLCDHLKHHNTILQAAPPDFTYCPLILALLLLDLASQTPMDFSPFPAHSSCSYLWTFAS